MTLLLKDPSAVLDYMVDWGADYLGADALAESSWEVSPVESDGAAIVSSAFDYLTATVQIGGGLPGKLYRISNSVVTACGLEDCRSIMLRVEER